MVTGVLHSSCSLPELERIEIVCDSHEQTLGRLCDFWPANHALFPSLHSSGRVVSMRVSSSFPALGISSLEAVSMPRAVEVQRMKLDGIVIDYSLEIKSFMKHEKHAKRVEE